MILHDQEKIKDNRLLCELDMTHATKEETLAWLTKIIENETEKNEEEQDQALISECLDYIDELLEAEVVCTDEAMQRGLERIEQATREEGRAQILPKPKKGKKRLLKTLIAVAASFTVLFSGIAIAAATQGYDCAWAFLKDNFKRFTKMEPGDSYSEKSVTLIKGGETISYKSLEELMQTQKYNCMTFGYLPNGIQIQRVIEEKIDDTRIKLFFLLNDSNLSITVYNYQNVSEDELKQYPLYKSPSIDFYIRSFEETKFYAIGYTNGYEYQIFYSDYEELIKIIDNMKGITP